MLPLAGATGVAALDEALVACLAGQASAGTSTLIVEPAVLEARYPSSAQLVEVWLPTEWEAEEATVTLVNPAGATISDSRCRRGGAQPLRLDVEDSKASFFVWTEDRYALRRKGGSRELRLRFTTRCGEAETTAVTISAPAAELETEHTARNTYRIERSWPLSEAGGPITLRLAESSGNAPLRKLRIEALRPHSETPSDFAISLWKIRASGGGEGERPPDANATQCSDHPLLAGPPAVPRPNVVHPGIGIARGSTGDVSLQLCGFPSAGEFEVDLAVYSPDLDRPALLPIEVAVTDPPWMPFLVVVVGVLVAFLVVRAVVRIDATRSLDEAITEVEGPIRKFTLRLANHVPVIPKGCVRKWTENARGKSDQLKAAQENVDATRLKAGDLGLLVLAALLGGALGFDEVYTGRYFGTGRQYLDAFLWGFGANMGLRVLASLVAAIVPKR